MKNYDRLDMKNYNRNETFTVNTDMVRSNSYGLINKAKGVELGITVGVSDKDEYGYFELYDIETGGDDWYAEGGLWFAGKKLTDYDGVFELSSFVVDKLNEWGYDTSEI